MSGPDMRATRGQPPRGAGPRAGARRSLLSFGAAVGVAQIAQVSWLLLAHHVLGAHRLAAVLTAISIFGIGFLVVDNGTTFLGAREAATDALTAERRDSIVRLRLQLAIMASAAGLAVSLSGGIDTAVAFLPYVAALVLAATLDVWEPFGRGDPIPIASWIALRGVGLLALVSASAVLADQLPIWAPGATEALCVAAIALVFRRPLVNRARAAAVARRGPWRAATLVGGPPILLQISLASGGIILNATGRATEAAAFLIGIRILGGVTNGASYLGGSLFPHIARSAVPSSPENGRARLIGFMQLAPVIVGGVVAAVACFGYHLILRLFLGTARIDDATALVALLSASAITGCVITMWNVLIAQNRERVAFTSLLYGTLFTVVAGCAMGGARPHAIGIWLAYALVLGQVVTYALLLRPTKALSSEDSRSLGYATIGTIGSLVLALPLTLATRFSIPAGVAESCLTLFAFAGTAVVLVRRAAWIPTGRHRRPPPALET